MALLLFAVLSVFVPRGWGIYPTTTAGCLPSLGLSSSDDDADLFEITDYSPSDTPPQPPTSPTPSPPPYPPYDSTPTLPRNIPRRDALDYLSFADDAGYDLTRDVVVHKWFGWERDEVDGDSETILLEAGPRLMTTHGLMPLDVDKTACVAYAG